MKTRLHTGERHYKKLLLLGVQGVLSIDVIRVRRRILCTLKRILYKTPQDADNE